MIKVGVLCIVHSLVRDVELNGHLVTVVSPLQLAMSSRNADHWAMAHLCQVQNGTIRAIRPINLKPISDPDSVDDRGDVLVNSERYAYVERFYGLG